VKFIRRRTRKQLKREYEQAAHVIAWTPIAIAGIAIAILLVVGAFWLAIWLITASSGTRGNADVTRQHNSGQNQVAQNTTLLNASAVVTSDEQKIKIQAANIATQQDRLDLAGLEQNCQTDVATYNADVRNILATGYLPAALPTSYAATACDTPTPTP
jgi:hypothetical protein